MKSKNVFCLGVWDMFHIAHLNLLEKASEYGKLRVGIVSDEGVKKQKGDNRPIICENDRARIIQSLKCVNNIILINDFIIPEFELKYTDFIIVGEDQSHIKNLNQIPKEKRINLQRTEGVSTSDIIKKIKNI